jgi:hypothetical protein
MAEIRCTDSEHFFNSKVGYCDCHALYLYATSDASKVTFLGVVEDSVAAQVPPAADEFSAEAQLYRERMDEQVRATLEGKA